MTQDARPRRIALALLLGGLAAGCQTSPKTATQPFTPFTPPAKAKAAAAPVSNITTTMPTRTPLVNGSAMNPPPPVVLPSAPGTSVPPLAAPTLPGVAPVVPARVAPESVLPMTPPSPAVPPEVGGTVAPPVSNPVLSPPSLK